MTCNVYGIVRPKIPNLVFQKDEDWTLSYDKNMNFHFDPKPQIIFFTGGFIMKKKIRISTQKVSKFKIRVNLKCPKGGLISASLSL